MTETPDAARLSAALRAIIKVVLVQGRKGIPAEGLLRFNPLHFHFLGALHQGPLRPSSLADALGVSRTTISGVTAKMLREGLVERRPDPGDGRATRLVLTVSGEAVAQAIRRQDARNANAMLAALDDAERAVLVGLIEKVAASLKEPD